MPRFGASVLGSNPGSGGIFFTVCLKAVDFIVIFESAHNGNVQYFHPATPAMEIDLLSL